MRRFVDLHTHSTASDGCLSPSRLIGAADNRRLAAVALTDHDTTDGLAEARAAAEAYPDLAFVAGIEVSAECRTGTMHILGLGIDEGAASMRKMCRFLQNSRQQRNPKIIARLQRMGMDIGMEDVAAVAAENRQGRPDGRIISRVHIAEALRRRKCVATTDEAFAKYIGLGRPAYVGKERFSPAKSIEAIRRAGGLAVLAHPPQLLYANRRQLERIVRQRIREGLGGLEVYHTDHTPQQTRLYLELARRFSLAVTGGSDYHGKPNAQPRLGCPRVPLAAMDEATIERLLGSA